MPLFDPDILEAPAADPRLNPDLVIDAIRPAITDERRERLERVIAQRLLSVTVVTENLYDPHNGAAVLRSAEALGLFHAHVIPGATGFDFAYKVTQRADKWLNVYKHADTASGFAYLQGAGFRVFGAVVPPPGQVTVMPDLPVDRPIAVVFGNEHEGLSVEARERCDGTFHWPMFGFAESFNLSVTAALVLNHLVAKRREWLGRLGDLPPSARRLVRAAYYGRVSKHAPDLILRQLQSPTAP
jgi:tRNA (guanosine-2'-O-)-methyltransferase